MNKKELEKVKTVLKKNPEGLSILEISKKIRINRNSVAKYMEMLMILGSVELRKVGPTKLYSLSKTLPVDSLLDLTDEIVISTDDKGNVTHQNNRSKDIFGNIEDISSVIPKKKGTMAFSGRYYRIKSINTSFEDSTQGIVYMLDDITKEKKLQDELHLLKKAVESSSCGITIADATKEDMPLIYVNPAFEKITGYKSSEILGKNCRFLQGKDTEQKELNMVRDALANKRDCRVILTNFTKQGKEFLNELRLSPVKTDGNVTHFVGIQTVIGD